MSNTTFLMHTMCIENIVLLMQLKIFIFASDHILFIMQILTIANRKGGVGKTTSAWAIAHTLASRGHRTLLVDCDPQRNLSLILPQLPLDKHIGLVASGDATLVEAMQSVGPQLWLVQATEAIVAAEKVLGTQMDYIMVLKNALVGLKGNMDYVIFDTSPSPHSPLAAAALTASTATFIPVHPEYLSYEGLTSLLDVVARVKRSFNPTLQVGGLFLTRYSSTYRKRLHHEFVDMLRQHAVLGPLLMQTTIRENVALAEAQVNRQSLQEYAPGSNAREDYENLTTEILERIAASDA
jgi:chromosome partitioning protein